MCATSVKLYRKPHDILPFTMAEARAAMPQFAPAMSPLPSQAGTIDRITPPFFSGELRARLPPAGQDLILRRCRQTILSAEPAKDVSHEPNPIPSSVVEDARKYANPSLVNGEAGWVPFLYSDDYRRLHDLRSRQPLPPQDPGSPFHRYNGG